MPQERVTLMQLRQAVSAGPDDAAPAHSLGLAFAIRGEYDDAILWVQRAAQLDPDRARCFFDLARMFAAQQQWEPAIEAAGRGLALQYDVQLALKHGRFYEKVGDACGALGAYMTVAQRGGGYEGYTELYELLLDGLSVGQAESFVGRLMPAVPLMIPKATAMAMALERHGRYPEALECWNRALRENPEHPKVLAGAANAWMVAGDLESSERLFARGLELHPGCADLVTGYLSLVERKGDIETLRNRVRTPEIFQYMAEGGFRYPEAAAIWRGTEDLKGKTIFVECDGGYGTVLHYCRFVALLRDVGASVTIEVPPKICMLLEALGGVDEVVAPFDECRPVDYQCRPLDVALFLDWTWGWANEAIPCLRADPVRRSTWARRFDREHVHVGIAWRSRAHDERNTYTFRSAPLSAFEPLAHVPGVVLHGLQVGPGAAEVTPVTREWLAGNLEEETRDFRNAAAAIDALDAVVTIDSAIAHLAGVLGKTCFMLLPYCPSSRWMSAAPPSTDHECLWYPSVRMFIQQRPGDWASAMAPIVGELETLARSAPVQLQPNPAR